MRNKRFILLLALVNWLTGSVYGQWAGGASIILDGNNAETAYKSNGAWSISWNDDSLFIVKKGGNTSEPTLIFFDIDPNFPVTGGSGADGNVVGTTDYGVTAELPFRADLRIYWTTTSAPEYRIRNGSGWGSANNLISSEYANNGSDRELKIAWNVFPSLTTRPSKFDFVGYCLSTATPGYSYDASPVDNPNGTYTTPYCEYYWRCNNTTSSNTHNPFNYKCYTYLGSSGSLGYIADIYDFTLNKASTTITKTAKWVTLGNLIVADGTINFSSNSDSLIIEDSLVVMGTGKLDMQTSTGIVWVKKSFTQKSTNSFDMSNQNDASLIVGGNFRVESNINTVKTDVVFYDHKSTQVLQTISGDLKNDNSFYALELNNGAGINLNVTDSLSVRDSFIFTDGIVNVPSGKYLKFRGNIQIINTGGPTSGKFVNGKLARQLDYTNDSLFHVGKGSIMAACAIQPSNTSTNRIYIAEYFDSPHQYSGSSSANLVGSSGLDHASYVEFWEISCNKSGTEDDAKVSLNWTSNTFTSSSSTDRSELRVSHWNGSTWDREGNSPSIIDNGQNDGNIKSDTSTSDFSSPFFTIGSNTSPNPLPITLLSFQAKRNSTNSALITWQTSTETNNAGFELYSSLDAHSYELITSFEASKPNSNQIKEYSYSDNQAPASIAYYQLVQLDLNGNRNTYGPIAIEAANLPSLVVYPNPAFSELKFETNIPLQLINSIIISNVLGQKILSLPIAKENNIDLPSGCYTMQITTTYGQQITRKFNVVR